MKKFFILTLFSLLFLGAATNAEAESLDGKVNFEQSIDNDIGEIQSYNFAKSDIGTADYQKETNDFTELVTLKINESEVVVLDYASRFSCIDTEEKPEINRFYENPYVNKNTDYWSYDTQRQKNSEQVNRYILKSRANNTNFDYSKSNKLLTDRA